MAALRHAFAIAHRPVAEVGRSIRRAVTAGEPEVPLAPVARLDDGSRQRADDVGQLGRRPWSVSLATLVSCCGDGGQVAGVLQQVTKIISAQTYGLYFLTNIPGAGGS